MFSFQVAGEVYSTIDDVNRNGAEGTANEFLVIRVNVVHCRTAGLFGITMPIGLHF